MSMLSPLRAELDRLGVDGFLIPRADRHQGEYVPACDARLAFVTGFDGSAGVAVVLPDQAALFVDGRYVLQARAQAVEGVEVVPIADKSLADWLSETLSAGQTIGYDPWLHTAAEVERLAGSVEKAEAALRALAPNPVDAAWTDRPGPPSAPAALYPDALAGLSSAEKRARLGETLVEEKLDAAVLTLPDGIAWALNTRGGDLTHIPITLAYALVAPDGSMRVFGNPAQWEQVAPALGEAVRFEPWEAFEPALGGFEGRRVAVDKSFAPAAIGSALSAAGAKTVWRSDLTLGPKARKTAAELKGARDAQRRDGAALVSTLAWIDATAPSGALSELSVSDALSRFRRQTGQRLGEPLLDLSFPAIVGFNPHAAMPHYRVTPESSLTIAGDGLLLLDSGGQYQDGTTDVTRTVAIGTPEPEAKAAFTRVLKGMIAISRLWFPTKTAGRDIDAFARAALWRAGLDYAHGTGHGVGAYLSVHEGPASISRRGAAALEPGMILSNEPGCYVEGAYGIRIENLVAVREPEAAPEAAAGATPMLSFETLTLAPIDRRLMAIALLDAEEIAWLDAYHARVLAEIGPLLPDEDARAWLRAACAPL
ncbi:MAG: aminopeptidase P family protein [Pseudomonadota bacterium]